MKNSPPKKPVANVTDLFSNPSEQNEPSKDITWLQDYEEQSMEYVNNQGIFTGVSTGYPSIDERIGSFLPGEVFTIGGDTGHGKSILAMNIAQNAYRMTQQPVLFVNLELTVEQAVQRFYHLSGEDHDYAGILVQTSVDLNYRDVDKLMQKAKAEGACLVVVDHLHFFDDSIADNAAAAITRIMKSFKRSAMKHELPVVLLSHVTPQTKITAKGIENIKPDLHSFKGSKSIEQVSDMVGFVFRDPEDPSMVEFYTRKNRSRELLTDSIYLKQDGWRLKETQ
jgi:replicative DNA helicase